MAGQRTVFNHVGLCVADTVRSRRFYEGLLDFAFWWELAPPDQGYRPTAAAEYTDRTACDVFGA